VPLLMFAVIDATALLDEPFSECAAFHLCTIRRLSDLDFLEIASPSGCPGQSKFAPNGLLSFDLRQRRGSERR